MWVYAVCLLGALGCAACAAQANEPDAPPDPAEVVLEPFACAPIEGAYRIFYAKRRGDCADLPEQLADFSDRASSSALNGDCQGTVTTSEDDCDREEDAVCPVIAEDGATIGSAKLLTAFTQTSAMRIEGMATIELDTDAGSGCTATYSLIGTKVE